jgi:cell division protein FtsI/penicillin-binding protein 2
MNLRTGRILVYASRSSGSAKQEPITSATQPAADVLKLITLAAAMDRLSLTDATRLCFRDPGKKLELDDLIEDEKRDTWCPSIGEALARNMDGAFARLGRKLSRDALEQTAGAFGFGKTIPFDVPIEPSTLTIPDTEEGLVEASIGSNPATMSAMQGLLLVSTIATKGVMVKPVLVESVDDDKGQPLYRAAAEPAFLGRPIGVRTAEVLSRMMVDTIEIGTAFRAFHDETGHPVLRDVNVGGKTGDATDAKTNRRTTWFVGFAPAEDPQIAIATVAQHSGQSDGTAPVISVDVLRAYFEATKGETTS